jgi:hypothetical protein
VRNPGEILKHEDYTFGDGKKAEGPRYLIVLNEPTTKAPCLILETTSQAWHFPGATPGCNSKRAFFLISANKEPFPLDTYVKLVVKEIDSEQLLNDFIVAKKISHYGELSVECFKLVKGCLALRWWDIAGEHWQIIFPNKRQPRTTPPASIDGQ